MTRLIRARHAAERFFRTPKGLLILLLLALMVVAAFGEDFRQWWQGLVSAVVIAAAVDAPILRWHKKRWEFPSGAVLTGMLVAMVMSPHEPCYGTFELLGVVYYLLAGVLVGNVQEAWRRAHHMRRSRRPALAS